MFDLSQKGILFSKETIQHIYPRIVSLDKESGFDSVMALIDILHDLSTSRNIRTLLKRALMVISSLTSIAGALKKHLNT